MDAGVLAVGRGRFLDPNGGGGPGLAEAQGGTQGEGGETMERFALIDAEGLLQLGAEDLRRVWDDLPEMYQDTLICHPRIPLSLLLHAVKTGPWRAWRMGWYRDGISPELAWALLFYCAFTLKVVDGIIVRHPSVTPDMLAVLMEIGDAGVRCNILDSRNVTVEVLERLAHDPHRDIRREAAKRLRMTKQRRSQ